MLVACGLAIPLQAQLDWNRDPGGDVINNAAWYIGARAGSTQSFKLKTVNDLHIDLLTSNSTRMRINPNIVYGTLGALSNVNADGYVGISPNNTLWVNGPGPFSRLHLHDGTTGVFAYGYRPWMQNGITFTTNNDYMWFGQKNEGTDVTAAVIQWGDNGTAPLGPDVLKFVFGAGYTVGNTYGPIGLNGLELGRFDPSGYFGVGDFQSVGLSPTERVDLVTGRLRIRDLPGNAAANTLTKVLVVDDAASPSGERGVVKWRDISTLTACDWVVSNSPALNVVTGYGAGPCPPGEMRGVGVGNQSPKAKLDVYYAGTVGSGSTLDGNTGISSRLAKATGGGVAIVANAAPSLTTQFTTGSMRGVQGNASNANTAYGVEGIAGNGASSPGTATDVIGVRGSGAASNNATRVIGVYGTATGAQSGNSWAGWFDGLTFCTLGVWSASDEQFKQNIEKVDGASELLARLEPRTYEFKTDAYRRFGFAPGKHIGLLAQEVEQVVPSAVRDVTSPAEVDSMGAITGPATSFKAVNYQELIPLLIASNNEQFERLKAQEARLRELEEKLNACCMQGVMPTGTADAAAKATTDPLTIAPNPFTDRTTIRYQVPVGGRVRLEAATQEGRRLEVLREEKAQAGVFTYEWNTAGMAPGTYLVTLLLDDQVVVKKAVKVDR